MLSVPSLKLLRGRGGGATSSTTAAVDSLMSPPAGVPEIARSTLQRVLESASEQQERKSRAATARSLDTRRVHVHKECVVLSQKTKRDLALVARLGAPTDPGSVYETEVKVPFTMDDGRREMVISDELLIRHWAALSQSQLSYAMGKRHPAVQALYDRQNRLIPDSIDWHRRRQGLLTASSIGYALAWCDKAADKRYGVFWEKVTLNRVDIAKDNAFVRMLLEHGKFHEEHAARVYEYVTGHVLEREPIGLVFDSEVDFLAATPDMVVRDRPLLIEIKCPKMRKITHQVPCHYYPQLQIQMHVTGIHLSHFVQYLPPTLTSDGILDILEVPYNAEWCKAAIAYLTDFQAMILETRALHSQLETEGNFEAAKNLLDRAAWKTKFKRYDESHAEQMAVLRPRFLAAPDDPTRSLIKPLAVRGPPKSKSSYFRGRNAKSKEDAAVAATAAMAGDSMVEASIKVGGFIDSTEVVDMPLLDRETMEAEIKRSDDAADADRQRFLAAPEIHDKVVDEDEDDGDDSTTPKTLTYMCRVVVHSDFELRRAEVY